MSVRLAARNQGLPAGAFLNVQGLPRLVILSEGERHLTAIDRVSGEVRWRYVLGPGPPSRFDEQESCWWSRRWIKRWRRRTSSRAKPFGVIATSVGSHARVV